MPRFERFVADTMLGRLAKWLRLLGVDVEYDPHAEDSSLLRRCLDDPGRVLLTRDTALMRRRPVARGQIQALFLTSNDVWAQLRQVVDWAAIDASAPRCPVCNSRLANTDRAKVKAWVPPYVFETQELFQRCLTCGRIYWRATHWDRIARVRREMARAR